MPQFEVVIRIQDVGEADSAAARQSVEERLRMAGIQRWQVIQVTPQGLTPARNGAVHPTPKLPPRRQPSYAGGTLVVAAVVAWAAWFLWMLAG
jgi:hypothetical protein